MGKKLQVIEDIHIGAQRIQLVRETTPKGVRLVVIVDNVIVAKAFAASDATLHIAWGKMSKALSRVIKAAQRAERRYQRLRASR